MGIHLTRAFASHSIRAIGGALCSGAKSFARGSYPFTTFSARSQKDAVIYISYLLVTFVNPILRCRAQQREIDRFYDLEERKLSERRRKTLVEKNMRRIRSLFTRGLLHGSVR